MSFSSSLFRSFRSSSSVFRLLENVGTRYNLQLTASAHTKLDGIDSRDHWVVGADEGRTIVLYHPERPFPYEHSLPISREESLLNEEESVLRLDLRKDVLEAEAARDKTPLPDQLAAKFFSPRRKFIFSGRMLRRLKKNKLYPPPPPDRDGL